MSTVRSRVLRAVSFSLLRELELPHQSSSDSTAASPIDHDGPDHDRLFLLAFRGTSYSMPVTFFAGLLNAATVCKS
jgi:hypothetical protein